jgi:hypothetical protein
MKFGAFPCSQHFQTADPSPDPAACAACFIHVPPGDFTRKEQLCEMLEEDPDFEASVVVGYPLVMSK